MAPLVSLVVILIVTAGFPKSLRAGSPGNGVAVTVENDFPNARPSETISVPWSDIVRLLPGALIQHISVKDSTGRTLPYQVLNVAPLAKDPNNAGTAYGDLIFQHDFSAGEKSAIFRIEPCEEVSPVFPVKAFARFVPERLDDFAWENDRIAHRTYGPALAAPAGTDSKKEVLVSSGLDVWCKRVAYPIVDRWYNKGHDHYHRDEGEGMDMYQTGASRGCGGTGVWNGGKLHVSSNYATWKVLANGPIRAVFELGYAPWDAGEAKVSETKRFTVDAGHNLDMIESTFQIIGGDGKGPLVVGIGLNKDSADKGQEPKTEITTNAASGFLTLWVDQKSNGSIGTAVIVPDAFAGFAEDAYNQLILAMATPGKPLRYYAGACWSKAGLFRTAGEWNDYVSEESARIRSPLRITVAPLPLP